MADDVDIDMAALCLCSEWESDALRFFEDGGVLPEPESTIGIWVNKHVANAAHRKKVEAAVRGAYPDLRSVLRALAEYDTADEGVSKVLIKLLDDVVPTLEARHIAKSLHSLYGMARPVTPSEWATNEPSFTKYLRSRLRAGRRGLERPDGLGSGGRTLRAAQDHGGLATLLPGRHLGGLVRLQPARRARASVARGAPARAALGGFRLLLIASSNYFLLLRIASNCLALLPVVGAPARAAWPWLPRRARRLERCRHG